MTMISEVIREIRKRNYLNQTEFANRIGVTQGTISQWEHNLTRPNLDQLKAISAAFNISVDDMLKGEPIKEPEKGSPKTPEARIVSGGMDRLPKDQREKILAVVRAMFSNHPELFTEEDSHDTEL